MNVHTVFPSSHHSSHWPDCNWCTSSPNSPNGRVHLVHDNSTSGNDSGSTSDGEDDNYEDEAVRDTSSGFPVARRRSADAVALGPSELVAAAEVPGPQAPLGALPTAVPSVVPTPPATTTTATAVAGSSGAPQAAAKTCTPSPTKSMSPSASK